MVSKVSQESNHRRHGADDAGMGYRDRGRERLHGPSVRGRRQRPYPLFRIRSAQGIGLLYRQDAQGDYRKICLPDIPRPLEVIVERRIVEPFLLR